MPAELRDAVEPRVRDRIVVLGRRSAGKTVFLSRLYGMLWQAQGDLRMSAVDGPTHIRLIEDLDTMSRKRWPASTEGLSSYAIDITYRGSTVLLITPDYSGEIFRQAFMLGQDNPLVRDLLSNIDRAAALIVLLDPGVALDGGMVERADQEFGLTAVVKRIRDWPGGQDVPVALTVTKCDRYRFRIVREGGVVPFVKFHFRNLVDAARIDHGRVHVSAAAAVRSTTDGLGREIPNLDRPPVGIVESLEYCLDSMADVQSSAAREDLLDRLGDKGSSGKGAPAPRGRLVRLAMLLFTAAVVAGAVIWAFRR